MNLSKLRNKFSSKGNILSLSKGFTLIELLIVIAILGVLAAGILVAIDPVDKTRQANDAKIENAVSAIGRANEAYATLNGGTYATSIAALITAGELKNNPSTGLPTGYSINMSGTVVCGTLLSKRYTATPRWFYTFATGVSAPQAAAAPCP